MGRGVEGERREGWGGGREGGRREERGGEGGEKRRRQERGKELREERRGVGGGKEGRGGRKVVPACLTVVPCSKRREGFPPSIQEETGIHSEGGIFSKCRD